MESKIAKALGLRYEPVAILWEDERPGGALGFKPGRFGCVMSLFAAVAQTGRVAAFDRETYGCWGGGVGLGFGNAYRAFPGGEACFYRFLSSGNATWETGQAKAESLKDNMGKEFAENFLKGEGYLRGPEQVKSFIESLPIREIPARFSVFAPLKAVDGVRTQTKVVTFLANPDQLAALVVLAHRAKETPGEAVAAPWAAGCQSIGILSYYEAERENPRAILGLMDISARRHVRKLGADILSLSVPFSMFLAMEDALEGSFVERSTWKSLLSEKEEEGGV